MDFRQNLNATCAQEQEQSQSNREMGHLHDSCSGQSRFTGACSAGGGAASQGQRVWRGGWKNVHTPTPAAGPRMPPGAGGTEGPPNATVGLLGSAPSDAEPRRPTAGPLPTASPSARATAADSAVAASSPPPPPQRSLLSVPSRKRPSRLMVDSARGMLRSVELVRGVDSVRGVSPRTNGAGRKIGRGEGRKEEKEAPCLDGVGRERRNR